MDYADAKASGLTFASVKNSAGDYVAPSVSSATAAASQATVAPNLTFSAIWAPGASSYPITYQSWVLVYQAQPNTNDTKMLQAYTGYLLGTARNCSPSWATRRCPPTSNRWPRRSSARLARQRPRRSRRRDVSTVTLVDQIGSSP